MAVRADVPSVLAYSPNSFSLLACRHIFTHQPERIEGRPYTIRSDVWSTGLSLLEFAQSKFPYPPDLGPIDLLQVIVKGPVPELDDDAEGGVKWSEKMKDFVKTWYVPPFLFFWFFFPGSFSSVSFVRWLEFLPFFFLPWVNPIFYYSIFSPRVIWSLVGHVVACGYPDGRSAFPGEGGFAYPLCSAAQCQQLMPCWASIGGFPHFSFPFVSFDFVFALGGTMRCVADTA